MQLKFSFFLLSVIVAARAATVANVLTDLDKVKTQVTNLANAINAFPGSGGSLGDVLNIHNEVTSAKSAIDTTTSDAKSVQNPISESDGKSVLDAITGIEPVVTGALKDIVTKKASFQTLPIGGATGLVKQDLTNLQTSTSNLEAALISKVPADLSGQANDIKTAIDAAFATAIAAYS